MQTNGFPEWGHAKVKAGESSWDQATAWIRQFELKMKLSQNESFNGIFFHTTASQIWKLLKVHLAHLFFFQRSVVTHSPYVKMSV